MAKMRQWQVLTMLLLAGSAKAEGVKVEIIEPSSRVPVVIVVPHERDQRLRSVRKSPRRQVTKRKVKQKVRRKSMAAKHREGPQKSRQRLTDKPARRAEAPAKSRRPPAKASVSQPKGEATSPGTIDRSELPRIVAIGEARAWRKLWPLLVVAFLLGGLVVAGIGLFSQRRPRARQMP